MATGVGRGGICLTSFNSPTPKTSCCVQASLWYLPHKPSYCLFCLNFVAVASLGWKGLILISRILI